MTKTILIYIFLALIMTGNASIYEQYYQQCKKIVQAMTVDQKIGQTIQLTFDGITQKQITDPNQALKYYLGSLLVGGNGAPTADGNLAKLANYMQQQKNKQIYMNATPTNWKKLADRFTNIGVSVTTRDNKKYLIKLLLGTDAVHGDQHGVGNVIFPHNIGLASSHNPTNFQNLGFWTKQDVKKSGFNFVFAPCVAVTHNPQWGRTYQSMGQQDQFIQLYAKAFVKGAQDVLGGKIRGVLTSVKHFFGDGSTRYGANEGSATVITYKKYIEHNIKGYRGAISAEVGNVMASYSSVNFVPSAMNSGFLMGLLRDEQNFGGFTISDYDDVELAAIMSLPRTYINITVNDAYSLMTNAGIDMFMLSSHKGVFSSPLQRLIKDAKRALLKQYVLEQRLNQAVVRILAVKMAMGLITLQNGQQQQQNIQVIRQQKPISYPESSSGNQYQDSLTAVHESLVVLKNSNILPLKSLYDNIKYVVLVGESIININRLTRVQLFRAFDNIGMQCGGWTVRWQGFEGNDFYQNTNRLTTNASSILDALKQIKIKNNFNLVFPNYTTFTNQVKIDQERKSFITQLTKMRTNMTAKNTIIIGVFGEVPYAESVGDVNIPYCRSSDLAPYCTYDPILNVYVPQTQSQDLTLNFSKFETDIITNVRTNDKNIPLISVLFTGRPVPIGSIYDQSNAVIAAWLPGTSGGQGVVDLISGNYVARPGGVSNRQNSLSVDWPKSMISIDDYFPIYGTDGEIPKMRQIQFPVGFGLSTEVNQKFLTVSQI